MDDSGDRPGETHHLTKFENAPFVTFAGPWATAMWTVEHDPDVDDFDEALEYAWNDSSDGDTAKYGDLVGQFEGVAAMIGLPLGWACPWACPWEYAWINELEPLWPVVCEVAALLIAGETVTHEVVRSLLDAHEVQDDDQ